MSTKQSTADFILDQLSDLKNVRARKMFGEYALYANNKVVGLICDNALFIKITQPGKSFVNENYQEGLPYPGAKPAIKISTDQLENRDWLIELINLTEANLPQPKKK